MGYIKGLIVCPNGERISRMEKHVGMILADSHQDRASRRTFPSVEGMAEDAVMSERHFQRMLASLERKGVIRREYPDGRGRGKTTYYFFPELDEVSANQESKKGDILSPFSEAKGCKKGDRRVTSATSPIRNNKSNRDNKSKTPPNPLASEGAEERKAQQRAQVEDGITQVCTALDISNPRKRNVFRRAFELEAEKGELPPATALAMIAALRRKAELSHLLRPCSLDVFIGLGIWLDENRWPWDNTAIRDERQRRRVG